ncbi:MAG TPA: tyrosinase family protein [Nannocystaceae bacterium]|nr:tyrosinase family protein [Nannocystaceae bacterium]
MIVIDPGHGGRQPSGRSTPFGHRSGDGVLEKDVTLQLGRLVAARMGGSTVLTRTTDTNPSLAERAAIARGRGARAFVSLHLLEPRFGATGRGATVMVHPAAPARAAALAFAVRSELVRVYGGRVAVERHVPVAVLHPHRLGPHAAGIQIELDVDRRRWGARSDLPAIGDAIARGVQRYAQVAAAPFVDPNKVSCQDRDRSLPIFTAIGTNDPAGTLDAIAHRAVELMDAAIGELTHARDRIAAGEPAAFPVLSDAVAWSLQNRMLMRVEDAAAWTGRGPRTAEQIIRWMTNIRDQIAGRDLHYTCIAATNCDADTWAWVIPGEYRVNLCRRFWHPRAGHTPELHRDFQALTLVHEVSHIYYDTEDSGRGPGAAECIAQFVGDVNNVPLDADFAGRCGPVGHSDVQSLGYGRVVVAPLQLQSSRFQGDPVLTAIDNHQTSLHVGSSGEAVRKVQQALLDLGIAVSVDGQFGPQTGRAVRQFQQNEGLGADGVVGHDTLAALDARFSGGGGPAVAVASNVRVRRNITALSATEIAALAAAMNDVKRRRAHHAFVRDHANSMPTAHRQAAFPTWHRSFILNYESELRASDPSVTLPYWDWANDPGVVAGTPMWNAAMVSLLGGDGDPSAFDRVTTGPFSAWTMVDSSGNDTSQPLQRTFGRSSGGVSLPVQSDVRSLMSVTPYDLSPWDDDPGTAGFRNTLEGWWGGNRLHNRVHVWVGGAMLPGTSPNDPCFFLNHAMVDKLFADWQAANPTSSYLPTARTARAGGRPDAFGWSDDVATFDVSSGTPFTVKASDVWTMTNLFDHLGNTGIEVRYA